VTHIIALGAKKLSDRQSRYPSPKRELLAVVFALKKWREYLYGVHFILETDHKALCYIHKSNANMILDWTSFLLEFNFTVVHKLGFLNVLPNSLSQLYDLIELDLKAQMTRDNRNEIACALVKPTDEIDESAADLEIESKGTQQLEG